MTSWQDELPRGLTKDVVLARQRQEGFNELPRTERRSLLNIVARTLKEPLFAFLMASGAIYLALGDLAEALILLAFATVSVAITIIQDTRSERVLEALRDLSSPRALVVRDGEEVRVPAREVVRDDLIVLMEGDRVAADGIILSGHDLLLDESLLTGESAAVRKAVAREADIAKLVSQSVPPGGDDKPVVFSGSLVLRGSGMARVSATGPRSEIGKIGNALASITMEQPHLQKQIKWVVRDFAIVAAVVGFAVIAIYGLTRGQWLNALLAGIAVGMSLLPEEFPLVLAVFMAMGARRISRANVLTRHAAAIETLGSATVICTDKTGTLTENNMSVAALAAPSGVWKLGQVERSSDLTALAVAARLAARPDCGDPMDRAVADFAAQYPAPPLSLTRTYGLTPELRAITNVWRSPEGDVIAYCKGAPEDIVRLCGLPAQDAAVVAAHVDGLADNGIRVLGVAVADVSGPLPEKQDAFTFRYLGLVGFADPLRADVPQAVQACRDAGIRVIMITGDYPKTARAIAGQAGIANDRVISGEQLSELSDKDLREAIRTTSVFARVRPTQKLRLVEALKGDGEVVAMTGDGVNDAPALKAAHIGVAMGGRGTDVAREASSIVLLQDDFGSLVKTVRLGRRIYDNLRKAIAYIIAVHIPIAGLALLPLALGLPLILAPIHIAFLEMVIDPACSIIFEAEPSEDDVMRRPPRDPSSSLVPRHLVLWSLIQGFAALTIVTVSLFAGRKLAMPEADLRSLAFTTLVGVNVALIFVNRSFSGSLLAEVRRRNRSLWILLAGIVVVLGFALYSTTGRGLFHFGPLHVDDLSICAVLSVGMLGILNLIKRKWRTAYQ